MDSRKILHASGGARARSTRRHLILASLPWLLLFWGCSTPSKQSLGSGNPARPVRVACVGDSITYGAGLEDRERNAYPRVVGGLLGAGFETRNFGVSGATLSRQGDLPYWSLPQFAQLKEYQPDAIVLKLGTNDTKPQNWKSGSAFREDLESMLNVFAALPSQPQVWLCLPVPVYETRWGINEEVLSREIIPVLREVGKRRSLPIIDLHTALSGRPEYFPDKIHPNDAGAAMIAMAVYVALKGRY